MHQIKPYPSICFFIRFTGDAGRIFERIDPVEFNREHYEFYRKLIALRKKFSVLINGDITFLASPEKVLVYERRMGSECITVVINTGNSFEQITLRPGVRAIDLLSDQSYSGTFKVAPFSAYILKHL